MTQQGEGNILNEMKPVGPMTIRIKIKDEGSIDYLVYIHAKFFFFLEVWVC